MSTRTTARGTAMTGAGCSAPTLAPAAVERPLLYDALMLTMADTGWRPDEQTNAGPSGRGAPGGSGVSHGMIAPHTVSGGGTVDLPGCGRPRSVASNPKVGEAGAHGPWKSRGRSLPFVPAVPAARFPQPHSASSSSVSIIGNDLYRARKSCAGPRGLDDHEGMTTHPESTLTKPSACLNNRDHFTDPAARTNAPSPHDHAEVSTIVGSYTDLSVDGYPLHCSRAIADGVWLELACSGTVAVGRCRAWLCWAILRGFGRYSRPAQPEPHLGWLLFAGSVLSVVVLLMFPMLIVTGLLCLTDRVYK